jgi:hypothetical protein
MGLTYIERRAFMDLRVEEAEREKEEMDNIQSK